MIGYYLHQSRQPTQAELLPPIPISYNIVFLGADTQISAEQTTEYTEKQRLLSELHSIMRVKFAQAGMDGGARPPLFITFTITSKVAVYAPAE